jgi:hypothetical protein
MPGWLQICGQARQMILNEPTLAAYDLLALPVAKAEILNLSHHRLSLPSQPFQLALALF